MPIDLQVRLTTADLMPKISLDADQFAKQMMSDFLMLRERLEEAQKGMILEANMSRRTHDSKVGDFVLSAPGSSRFAVTGGVGRR